MLRRRQGTARGVKRRQGGPAAKDRLLGTRFKMRQRIEAAVVREAEDVVAQVEAVAALAEAEQSDSHDDPAVVGEPSEG